LPIEEKTKMPKKRKRTHAVHLQNRAEKKHLVGVLSPLNIFLRTRKKGARVGQIFVIKTKVRRSRAKEELRRMSE